MTDKPNSRKFVDAKVGFALLLFALLHTLPQLAFVICFKKHMPCWPLSNVTNSIYPLLPKQKYELLDSCLVFLFAEKIRQ